MEARLHSEWESRLTSGTDSGKGVGCGEVDDVTFEPRKSFVKGYDQIDGGSFQRLRSRG
jgi:hypothetical protein